MLRLARWISIVAHPFVMIPLWIAAVTAHLRGPGEIMGNVGLVALFIVVPNIVFMVRQVRRGAWGNVDASNRHERPMMYLVGLGTVVLLVVYLAAGTTNSFLLRGCAVTLAMLALCALTSRWIKVSLHLAAARLTATSLVLVGSPVGWMLAVIVPLLAWSRVALGRHSWREVGLGFAHGLLAGAVLHAL